MVTRIYKVYRASEYNSIDKSKVTSNIRWSLDDSQFIVEFIELPDPSVTTLSLSEANNLMGTKSWNAEPDFGEYEL